MAARELFENEGLAPDAAQRVAKFSMPAPGFCRVRPGSAGSRETSYKLYPKIKVNFVVIRANQIPIRISTEQRAGKFRVDVTSASAWQVSALASTGALDTYKPPEAKNLIPEAVDKKHQSRAATTTSPRTGGWSSGQVIPSAPLVSRCGSREP
jgi:hypothetical protein